MSASPYILSIDLGTGGPKVALVGTGGEIAASAVRSVETLHLGPGAAEQDPEEIWNAIVSAAQQVVREAGLATEAILAVACTSQYFSVVPIDDAGRPVGKMIPWMDGRGGRHSVQIYGAHPDAFLRWIEIAGMPPLPSGNDSLSHMLFFQKEQPEIYDRAHKLVEPVDYVTTRLTGVCASNPCTAFAQLLTDNRSLDAVVYHDELLAFSGIDREKLPDLVPVGSCLGTVLPEVAREIGLPPRTKVFAGVNDTQAASIGTGVFQKGRGGISVGTTCQVLGFVDRMATDIEHSILSMPSPIPNRYMVMAENGLGARLVEHFLREMVFANDALADHVVKDPFATLETALQSTPAGSGGLLYLPWLTGSQSPIANGAMRGGFLNLSLETRRTHMARAVLEGITYNLCWLLPLVERFSGQEFSELRFAGGGAVSDAWSQMMADVMDRPVLQMAEARYVNNRATAFLGFEQLGLVSLDEIEKLCPIKRTYEPDPKSRETYQRLFAQFVAAHEQTRPLFEALNG